MELEPITLEGQYVRLEPLSRAHRGALVAAAADGELWNSTVTVVPSPSTVDEYIEAAFTGQALGRELAFVIICNDSEQVIGSTRFYNIERDHRTAAIGYTWLARTAQRTAANTEAKLLLLTHAFERWQCIRIELVTDVLNEQSRAAILRLGAKEEGILRNHLLMPNGRIRDSVCFSIITDEWPAVKARLETKLTGRAKTIDGSA